MLAAYREGEEGAFDRLVAMVYDDLRRLARRQRYGRPNATLNTTALVHEAYLKLAGGEGLGWNDRAHFLAVAAHAMRHILVDYAKSQKREKRGGGAIRVELDERQLSVEREVEKLLAVDQVLGALAEDEPRLVQVVECRYFAGMTMEETAAALNVSLRTAERNWQRAKSELKRRITGS